MITKGMMTSNTPEWATPQWLFDELDKEFGFDLDPCSTDENAKCKKHYTKEQDGLVQSWGGVMCSATHRMAGKSGNGSRSVTKKASERKLWHYSRLVQTPNGFTTTYLIVQKYGLSRAG